MNLNTYLLYVSLPILAVIFFIFKLESILNVLIYVTQGMKDKINKKKIK